MRIIVIRGINAANCSNDRISRMVIKIKVFFCRSDDNGVIIMIERWKT